MTDTELADRVIAVARAVLSRREYGQDPTISARGNHPHNPTVIQVVADYRQPHGARLILHADAASWKSADAAQVAERFARHQARLNSGEHRVMQLRRGPTSWVVIDDAEAGVSLLYDLEWQISIV
jgi:hypothetical protein